MDNWDYETLKHFLRPSMVEGKDNSDIVHTVGTILVNEHALNTARDVLEYFEKPWHFEPEIKQLCADWEIDRIIPYLDLMIYEDAELALQWLRAFQFEDKAVDALEKDLSERELCPTGLCP